MAVLEDFDTDDDFESEDERVAAVGQILAEWQRETGAELTAEEWDRMGVQIDLYGMSADEAFAETDSGRSEAAFDNLVDRIEADQGRTLTESELQRLAHADAMAEWEGEDEVDVSTALFNLDGSADDRASYIGERLRVPPEREEPSATVVEDDGDERPGYNASSPDELAALIDARLEGQDVAVYDNDSHITEGDND